MASGRVRRSRRLKDDPLPQALQAEGAGEVEENKMNIVHTKNLEQLQFQLERERCESGSLRQQLLVESNAKENSRRMVEGMASLLKCESIREEPNVDVKIAAIPAKNGQKMASTEALKADYEQKLATLNTELLKVQAENTQLKETERTLKVEQQRSNEINLSLVQQNDTLKRICKELDELYQAAVNKVEKTSRDVQERDARKMESIDTIMPASNNRPITCREEQRKLDPPTMQQAAMMQSPELNGQSQSSSVIDEGMDKRKSKDVAKQRSKANPKEKTNENIDMLQGQLRRSKRVATVKVAVDEDKENRTPLQPRDNLKPPSEERQKPSLSKTKSSKAASNASRRGVKRTLPPSQTLEEDLLVESPPLKQAKGIAGLFANAFRVPKTKSTPTSVE